MRILLDECLPRQLKNEIVGHSILTVQEMGWSSMKNGVLLKQMIGQFDVFITIDGNLQYQQNLSNAQIAVIVLKASNSKLESLKPLMADVRKRLNTIQLGEIVRFEAQKKQ